MEKYVRRSPLPISAAAALAWHARPGALERLLPPWDVIEVVERRGGIEPGGEVTLRVPMPWGRVKWLAQHVELPGEIGFRDLQVQGPFAHWVHTHRFLPTGPETCELEDEVEYEPPCGTLGKTFGAGIAQQHLAQTFRFRHARTVHDLQRHLACSQTPLRIAVTGASGLVGRNLCAFLTSGGHTVTPLERLGKDQVGWKNVASLSGYDAIVHLAGVSINGRWTAAYKEQIRASRVDGTRWLSEQLAKLPEPPKTLICASAVGYYGERGDTALTEADAAGTGFLAEVCQQWEAAAEPARAANIRVVHLRFGMVVAAQGGALAQLRTPFGWGLGGPVGSGKQFMSWIALDDLLGAILWNITRPELQGPVNAVAPAPLTNAEFGRTLGRVLHRPAVLPLPEFAVKTLFGEMGEALLLASTRVLPARLQASGFDFLFPNLESALSFELGKSPPSPH